MVSDMGRLLAGEDRGGERRHPRRRAPCGKRQRAGGLIAEASAGEDLERIREGMSGNLCRCAAYHGITRAVQQATRRMAEAEQEGTA